MDKNKIHGMQIEMLDTECWTQKKTEFTVGSWSW